MEMPRSWIVVSDGCLFPSIAGKSLCVGRQVADGAKHMLEVSGDSLFNLRVSNFAQPSPQDGRTVKHNADQPAIALKHYLMLSD
jgi:hypothetical protein